MTKENKDNMPDEVYVDINLDGLVTLRHHQERGIGKALREKLGRDYFGIPYVPKSKSIPIDKLEGVIKELNEELSSSLMTNSELIEYLRYYRDKLQALINDARGEK